MPNEIQYWRLTLYNDISNPNIYWNWLLILTYMTIILLIILLWYSSQLYYSEERLTVFNDYYCVCEEKQYDTMPMGDTIFRENYNDEGEYDMNM